MAQGDGALYNSWKEYIMEGIMDLATGGDTIQTTLHHGYSPNIDTHALFGNTGVQSTEYAAGAGYTTGGQTLAGQDVSQNNAQDRSVYDGTDEEWTALGTLTPAIPSHAIHWDDTPVSPTADPLIAYFELGTTPTNGSGYKLTFDSDGIILLT